MALISEKENNLMSKTDNRIGMAFLDRPDLARQIRLVKRMEELGYDSAWVCETRLARDAISVLGAFAASTSRIRLGTGIVNTWTRGPALMAVTFATLNELAPGRMICGLGAYWDPLAWKQGIDRKKPLTQMKEYVEVLRRLLALEEGVSFAGEVVNVREISLDLGHGMKREKVPVSIAIGPTGPKMMELAGEIADVVVLNGLLSSDYTRKSIEKIKVGAKNVGRDFSSIDCPQFVNVSMSSDKDTALENAHYLVTKYLGQQPHIGIASGLDEDLLLKIKQTMGGWPARANGIEDAMNLVSIDVVNKLTVSGTPDSCRSRVREWTDAGATFPIIVPLSDNYEEIVEAFSDKFF